MNVKKEHAAIVVLFSVITFGIILNSGNGGGSNGTIRPIQNYPTETATDSEKGRTVTIDGKDPAGGDIIDPINIWENYRTRTYAGRVKHGQKVTVIKRVGDGVLIETKAGLRGWVTYFFIKEYK